MERPVERTGSQDDDLSLSSPTSASCVSSAGGGWGGGLGGLPGWAHMHWQRTSDGAAHSGGFIAVGVNNNHDRHFY